MLFSPIPLQLWCCFALFKHCFLLFCIVGGHLWVVFRCLPIVNGVDGPLTMDWPWMTVVPHGVDHCIDPPLTLIIRKNLSETPRKPPENLRKIPRNLISRLIPGVFPVDVPVNSRFSSRFEAAFSRPTAWKTGPFPLKTAPKRLLKVFFARK